MSSAESINSFGIARGFDFDYYTNRYPDMQHSGIDPYEHFQIYGWREGRDPNPEFSTVLYLYAHVDVAVAGVNPLDHYLYMRRREGRRAWPASERFVDRISVEKSLIASAFDESFYRLRYADMGDRKDIDPLEHYCLHGWQEGRDPAPWFSTTGYLTDHTDVAAAKLNPFVHYEFIGRHEDRIVRPAAESMSDRDVIAAEFDEAYYRARYEDMDTSLDPVEHYRIYGWREGRDPAPWFNTRFYQASHPEVTGNPFVHYLLVGRVLGHEVRPAFGSGPRDLILDRKVKIFEDQRITDLVRYQAVSCQPTRRITRVNALRIDWVIPDFEAGSGGHMTIFRIVNLLEQMGHSCRIWIFNPSRTASPQGKYDDILKYFQPIRARVRFADRSLLLIDTDALIATSWDTVARVSACKRARQRFYFVQDYEPSFFATGSMSLAAEMSYRTDNINCICASPWLRDLVSQKYARWARSFSLAYDHSVYQQGAERPKNARTRIAFYSRMSTSRRAVELGLAALQKLAEDGHQFHVDFFGADLDFCVAPFPATVHGVITPEELADLYRKADIGVCFSCTNYSLVPQEMMACGLPVVEIDTESTRAIFPPGVVAFCGPHPSHIAAEIATLLEDPEERRRLSSNALAWVQQFDWHHAARDVEEAIVDRIKASENIRTSVAKKRRLKPAIKASVCIPVYNGGTLLKQVVEMVLAQQAPFRFDVLLIDSESTDGCCDSLMDLPNVSYLAIPRATFAHGRTRNLCADVSRGRYILFLTQDAMPVDDLWIHRTLDLFEHYPEAAGSFGRHIAWPEATPFTKRDLTTHFNGLCRYPLLMSEKLDAEKYGLDRMGKQQILHYFSDNNSCLKRKVWEKVPYRDCEFGEDQLWAHDIVRGGMSKLYNPQASVYHSHDYAPRETYERARTEAKFFREYFGYTLFDQNKHLSDQVRALNVSDARWGRSRGLPDDVIDLRMKNNHAKILGYEHALNGGSGYREEGQQ